MKYISKKWIFYASRPTGLFQREMRKNWYFSLEDLTNLKISKVLIISDNGYANIYLDISEDIKNNRLIAKDYQSGQVERNFKKFWKIIKKPKVNGLNPFEQAVSLHKAGALLNYSHFLERILTKKLKRFNYLNKKEQARLKELISQNSQMRDTFIRVLDVAFGKACQYFKKKYSQVKDLNYYLLQELFAGKQVSKKELADRKIFYVVIQEKNQTRLFTGKKAKEILKKEGFVRQTIKQINELKGFSACQGKVRGKISIVRNPQDFKRKKINQIIVAPMTVPQFVPYLKHAKALITDEGGVNCHAAVCAREFKIPCIVGIKIATQVLKDGDFVEVDANKGIVRKLTKSSIDNKIHC